jgi:putative intracellular protease/amidase
MMADELKGKKIAFVATDGVEEVELTEPWKAVEQAGGQPVLVSPKPGRIQGMNHMDKADKFDVDVSVAQTDPGDYEGLVLPGGVANPDRLRTDEATVAFIKSFFVDGKPVGVICHGPWTLVEGRHGARPNHHLMAQPADGHPKCWWRVGGRGVPHGKRRGLEPEAGRPSGLLREDRGGVRRGQARAVEARRVLTLAGDAII